MLLAIAVPSQWVVLADSLRIAMATGLIAGCYLLCLGMYIAAIWGRRGIPGRGAPLNRAVSGLYAAGTITTLAGSLLLTIGLVNNALR